MQIKSFNAEARQTDQSSFLTPHKHFVKHLISEKKKHHESSTRTRKNKSFIRHREHNGTRTSYQIQHTISSTKDEAVNNICTQKPLTRKTHYEPATGNRSLQH
jgi:hypothetical protein